MSTINNIIRKVRGQSTVVFGFILIASPVLGAWVLISPNTQEDTRAPDEKARSARAVTANAAHAERKKYWIGQIEAGEASFSEASCDIDLHGEWNDEGSHCAPRNTTFSPQ